MEKYNGAIKLLNKVPEGSLFHSEARFFQGCATYMLGECDRAVAAWNEVQKDNPLHQEAQFLKDYILGVEYALQDDTVQILLSEIGQQKELSYTYDIDLIGADYS